MVNLNSNTLEALESYLNAKSLDFKTISKYLDFYKRLANVHGELNQKTLDEFIKYNDNSISRSMLKHLIKSIIRWNFSIEIKNSITMLDIPKKSGKVKSAIPKHLSYEELQLLDKGIIGNSILNERDRLSILVQWWGGLRESELLGLTPEDFLPNHFDKNKDPPFQNIRIKSESAKFGKERIAYIPTDIYDRVFNYIKKRVKIDSNFVHKIKQKENIWGFKKSSYDKMLRKNTIVILGKPYNTHSLRHGRGTYLIKKGVPIEKVKKILGHSDIGSTQRYVHIVESEVEDSLV